MHIQPCRIPVNLHVQKCKCIKSLVPYHSTIVYRPLQNEWLCDDDQKDATQEQRKHEMDLNCNPVTAERPININSKAGEWKKIQSILIPIPLLLQILIPILIPIPQKPNYPFPFQTYPYVWKKWNSHSYSFKLPKNRPLQLKLRKLMLRRTQNTCHTESPFPPHVVLLSLAIQIILLFCVSKKQEKFLTSFIKPAT